MGLVLTRQPEQRIHIGDDIVITVIDVRGDRVRVDVVAPRTVAVHRHEVYDRIRAEAVKVKG
jgi:carbon storage regulator